MSTKKELAKLVKNGTDIERTVIADALNAEDPAQYLKEVLQHGCQSGIVSGLIYYHDTKRFYIDNIDEIEDIKNEFEDSIGEPIKIGTPMYNWLSWFAYEETARKIADKVGIEV